MMEMFDERIKALNSVDKRKMSYSIEEVQAILRVSRQVIYRLIKEEKFKAIKVENKYRIIKASFDEWLDGKEDL